uniref:DNA helicase n=1 Tax=Tanacetum cinerariifolium TaxID=118510 RepID=A0A6L2KL59_TANCI|nr:DNA helicase [Tanacetum cinerariifolium]
MSRDVLTVGSTMRIPLLYRGEYSQWIERFMNYLEEQTYGEAMINSIKNGDQPLPRVTQVSIAGATSTEQPPLKDKSMWSCQLIALCAKPWICLVTTKNGTSRLNNQLFQQHRSVKDFGLPPLLQHLLEQLKNKLLMEEKNHKPRLLLQEAAQLDCQNLLTSSTIKPRSRHQPRELSNKRQSCVKNDTADIMIAKILSIIGGFSKTYLSNDEAIPINRETSKTEMLYLMEYLNTMAFHGFPPHELELKVGSPIMLLRNVNLSGGLCNGTRMIVRYDVSVHALTKDHKGKNTNMPYPGKAICRIQAIWEYNILEDIKCDPYSKKLQYAVSKPLDTS